MLWSTRYVPSAYSETNKIWCLLLQEFNGAQWIATRVKLLPFLTTDGGCCTWPQRINHPYKNGLAKWLRRRSSPASIIIYSVNLNWRKLFLCFSVNFALPSITSGEFYGPHALLPPQGHILNLPFAQLSLSKSLFYTIYLVRTKCLVLAISTDSGHFLICPT